MQAPRVSCRLFAICASLVLLTTAALANPIATGTVLVPFQNSTATMSGSFTLNPNGTLASWNFTVTAGGNFPTFTYTSSDPNQLGGILSNDDGDQVFGFDASNPGANGGQGALTELDIVIACGSTANANCLTNNAALGGSFALATGITPCPPGTLKCISSGEQYVFDLIPSRLLGPAFLNVTDPPGGLSFNLDNVATGPILNNGGSGGGTGAVPEPASVLLLGAGMAGIATLRRRKSSAS